MFSTQSDNCSPFVYIFDVIFLFAAELEEPKIGISHKRLITGIAKGFISTSPLTIVSTMRESKQCLGKKTELSTNFKKIQECTDT